MRAVVALAVALFSVSRTASAACPLPDPQIAATINRLPDRGREAEVLDRLLQKPKAAACQLVAELKLVEERIVTPRIENEHRTAMQVAWSIRALRYITRCQDFGGSTKENFATNEFLPRFDLSNERKNFLIDYDHNNLPFFADWMSHDIVFFADWDAQSEIIAKWREWLDRIDQFEFGRCEEFNDWYF